jgi:hypothetical protein
MCCFLVMLECATNFAVSKHWACLELRSNLAISADTFVPVDFPAISLCWHSLCMLVLHKGSFGALCTAVLCLRMERLAQHYLCHTIESLAHDCLPRG